MLSQMILWESHFNLILLESSWSQDFVNICPNRRNAIYIIGKLQ